MIFPSMNSVHRMRSLIDDFTIGFWHPFGPHGNETPEQILARKQKEIDATGWTFWSFQHRLMLQAWDEQITQARPQKVLVFCSDDKDNKPPAGKIKNCSRYRMVSCNTENDIPTTIQIPHPMGKRNLASAFVVEEIISLYTDGNASAVMELFPAKWYRKGGAWEDMSVRGRGERLIRRGGKDYIRPYRAILVLKHPYLATIYP